VNFAKIIAIIPALIKAIGTPLNALGTLPLSILSRKVAKIYITNKKPTAEANENTKAVNKVYSSLPTIVAIPKTAQLVVINGK
jgi:hypothetical protein